MWQGFVAIAAAKAAEAGCSLDQVVNKSHETIRQLHALALLDTLKYAVKGGRLSRTIFKVESLLNVRPLITLRDGEIRPAGLVRNRDKGIDRLRRLISSALHVDDLAIVYSTTPDEVKTLVDYAHSLFPNIVPRIARLGPALGVHAGPGALVIVVKESMDPVKVFDLKRMRLSHMRTS